VFRRRYAAALDYPLFLTLIRLLCLADLDEILLIPMWEVARGLSLRYAIALYQHIVFRLAHLDPLHGPKAYEGGFLKLLLLAEVNILVLQFNYFLTGSHIELRIIRCLRNVLVNPHYLF
jgi:hypothetical protein